MSTCPICVGLKARRHLPPPLLRRVRRVGRGAEFRPKDPPNRRAALAVPEAGRRGRGAGAAGGGLRRAGARRRGEGAGAAGGAPARRHRRRAISSRGRPGVRRLTAAFRRYAGARQRAARQLPEEPAAGGGRRRRAGSVPAPAARRNPPPARRAACAWLRPDACLRRRRACTSPAVRTTRRTRGSVPTEGAPDRRAALALPEALAA